MKYKVTLQTSETAETNPDLRVIQRVELEADTVRKVRDLARSQHPGYEVKQVRRIKESNVTVA